VPKRKRWTKEEIRTLEKLVRENTPINVIVRKLDRTDDAIYAKASAENIPLVRPTSDAPNGRRTKSKPQKRAS
jgi:hypothetical protein